MIIGGKTKSSPALERKPSELLVLVCLLARLGPNPFLKETLLGLATLLLCVTLGIFIFNTRRAAGGRSLWWWYGDYGGVSMNLHTMSQS